MKAYAKITVLLLALLCMGGASGHENCETNKLIRKMLGPLLVTTRLSGDRIVRMPRSVSSQAEFFAGDDQWTMKTSIIVELPLLPEGALPNSEVVTNIVLDVNADRLDRVRF